MSGNKCDLNSVELEQLKQLETFKKQHCNYIRMRSSGTRVIVLSVHVGPTHETPKQLELFRFKLFTYLVVMEHSAHTGA